MLSYQSCTKWGLQRASVAGARVSSYLAFPSLPVTGRFLSVALSLESPPPGVTRHSALWCSDFPHPLLAGAVAFLTQTKFSMFKQLFYKQLLFTQLLFKFSCETYSFPYRILPQFSHSTMPSVVAIFLSITIGRDILHPPHLLLTIFAMGTAWCCLT